MKIRIILIIIFSLQLFIRIYAQSTAIMGDTIELSITGYKTGHIQWQYSSDKLNWNDINGATSEKLVQMVTKNNYYKAKISNNCNIYYSDTTLISVNSSTNSKIILTKDVFINGESGYSGFRIPTIIKTSTNRILVFAEGRNSGSDTGNIDVVMKYSDDFGSTWSKLYIIWDDGINTCGNPSPVFDEINQVIWLITCWNNGNDNETKIMNGTNIDGRRVFSFNSRDNGLTWSKGNEITSTVKNFNMRWYATGPCHGLQIKNNTNINRLIIPCCNSIGSTYYSHVIFSDDFGANWKLGGIVPNPNQNESTVGELSDGKLMLCIRNYTYSSLYYRTISYSNNCGITWSNAMPNFNLIEPICQGSLLSINSNMTTNSTLLFSNPSSKTTRNNLTIKMSFDGGLSWNDSLLVTKGPSAYSDLCEISENKVGIIYENGSISPYEKISYSLIRLF